MNLPYPVSASDGGNGKWLGDPDHLVKGADGDGGITFLTGDRSRPELRSDDVFVVTDRRFNDAASAIPIGLLPGQAAFLCDIPDMTMANGLELGIRVDDR